MRRVEAAQRAVQGVEGFELGGEGAAGRGAADFFGLGVESEGEEGEGVEVGHGGGAVFFFLSLSFGLACCEGVRFVGGEGVIV